LEIGQHGQNRAMVVGLGKEPEFGEDAAHVGFDRLGVEAEPVDDGLVRAPFGDQAQDLPLPGRQLVEWVPAAFAVEEPSSEPKVLSGLTVRFP